jgi:hypothetical protein
MVDTLGIVPKIDVLFILDAFGGCSPHNPRIFATLTLDHMPDISGGKDISDVRAQASASLSRARPTGGLGGLEGLGLRFGKAKALAQARASAKLIR